MKYRIFPFLVTIQFDFKSDFEIIPDVCYDSKEKILWVDFLFFTIEFGYMGFIQ